MKYWYDTEFYEDGERIHLISIGIVAEDGRELYLESSTFVWENFVPDGHWLWENVKPHLTGDPAHPKMIAQVVREFICNNPNDWTPNRLYAYYAAYDHVVLAQLFGRMVDMPKGMPWFTFDLKQMIEEDPHRLGNVTESVTYQGSQHHALIDARWNKALHEKITEWKRGLY